RRVVLLDARLELRVYRSQRHRHQGEALSAALSLLELRPRLPRDRDRCAQMIPAIDQHDAGKGQAVSVVQRMIALTITTPPPIAETAGDSRVALIRPGRARKMGLGGGPADKSGTGAHFRWEVIGAGEFVIFSLTKAVPAFELLPLVLALHGLFADHATGTVEARMAAAGAERMMLVLGWLRQLPPTVRVGAGMTKGRVHGALQ